MAGYLGTKAVLLSTTSATVGGDSTVGGDLTVDTNTLYVDSTNNNVGIGTSSPDAKLDVSRTGNGQIAVLQTSANRGFSFESQSDTALQIASVQGSTNLDLWANTLTFSAGASERCRIDSSGNLLVGHTSQYSPISDGGSGITLNANGQLFVGGQFPSYFNREDSDGDVAVFRKDGTAVGSIGASSSRLHINNGDTGLRFAGDSDAIWPCTTDGGDRDNAIDLGSTGIRFDDIYATNGTIQTSDQNEKQQIAALTDAEMAAAKAISKLFKTFKWNDSVTEKGDAARTHTGVIAQEVEQAMTDAGLNAGDYAFFISTTWWEAQTEVPAVEADEESGVEAQEAYTRTDTYETLEEAPEGATERNRKGIRYPQLMSFIGAATEQRLASIEARLDALEGN